MSETFSLAGARQYDAKEAHKNLKSLVGEDDGAQEDSSRADQLADFILEAGGTKDSNLPVIDYDQWIKRTKLGAGHSRSKELGQLDEAIKRYNNRDMGGPNQDALDAVRDQFEAWKKTKSEWTKSKRNAKGAMTSLHYQLLGTPRALRTAMLLRDIRAMADRDSKVLTTGHWLKKHEVTKDAVVAAVKAGVLSHFGLEDLEMPPGFKIKVGAGIKLSNAKDIKEYWTNLGENIKAIPEKTKDVPKALADGANEKAGEVIEAELEGDEAVGEDREFRSAGDALKAEAGDAFVDDENNWKSADDMVKDAVDAGWQEAKKYLNGKCDELKDEIAAIEGWKNFEDAYEYAKDKLAENDKGEEDKKDEVEFSDLLAKLDEEIEKCLVHNNKAKEAHAELEKAHREVVMGNPGSSGYMKYKAEGTVKEEDCEVHYKLTALSYRIVHHREKAKYYLASVLAVVQAVESMLEAWQKTWHEKRLFDLHELTERFNDEGAAHAKKSCGAECRQEVVCYGSRTWAEGSMYHKGNRGKSDESDPLLQPLLPANSQKSDEYIEENPYHFEAHSPLKARRDSFENLTKDQIDAKKTIKKHLFQMAAFLELTVALGEIAEEMGVAKSDIENVKVIAESDGERTVTLQDGLKLLGWEEEDTGESEASSEAGGADDGAAKGKDEDKAEAEDEGLDDPEVSRLITWLVLAGFDEEEMLKHRDTLKDVSSLSQWDDTVDEQFSEVFKSEEERRFGLMLLHIFFREEHKTYSQRGVRAAEKYWESGAIQDALKATLVTVATAATGGFVGIPVAVYAGAKYGWKFMYKEMSEYAAAKEVRELAKGGGKDSYSLNITGQHVKDAAAKIKVHIASIEKNLRRLADDGKGRKRDGYASCDEAVAHAWSVVKLHHHFEKVVFYRFVLITFADKALLGGGEEVDAHYGLVRHIVEDCKDWVDVHAKDIPCGAKALKLSAQRGGNGNAGAPGSASICYGPPGPVEAKKEKKAKPPKQTGKYIQLESVVYKTNSYVHRPLHLNWQHRADQKFTRAKAYVDETKKKADEMAEKAKDLSEKWKKQKDELVKMKKKLDALKALA